MVVAIVTENLANDGRPAIMQDATPDIRDSFADSIREGSKILSERIAAAQAAKTSCSD